MAALFRGSGRGYIPVRIKKEVIKKHGPNCFYCGKEAYIHPDYPHIVLEKEATKRWINVYDGTFYLEHRSMHFDHVKPLSKAGKTTVSNLVISCGECNLRKGAKLGGNREKREE